jgi:hypothetical protein
MHDLKYSPERYDAHLCLRVPATLWLTLAFLIRHLLLLGITFLPTTGDEIRVLRELIRPEYLIADLIALPVLVAAVRRRPRAPRWMRQAWQFAHGLLTVSATTYLLLLAMTIARSAQPITQTLTEPALVSALITLAILAYLARSPLLRDLFASWPSPVQVSALQKSPD